MIPLNMQVQEPQQLDPDGNLDVFKVWPTIQGEGPFAGMPAAFVRLAGCNLRCPGCDTDYTSRRQIYTPQRLAQLATEMLPNRSSLVVLTGGEPFRQNITPFIEQLIANSYQVQIETNGLLALDDFPYRDTNVSIVCSPKTAKVHDTIKEHTLAWKYIIQHGCVDAKDGLPTSSLAYGFHVARPPEFTHPSRIYVQPMDEGDILKNDRNLKAAVESCMKFGYRLCLQVHKYAHLE